MKLLNGILAKAVNLARRSNFLTALYHSLKLLLIYRNPKKAWLVSRVEPYSMSQYPKLGTLYELARQLEKDNTRGNFVECGVYNGSTAGIIAHVAKDNSQRHIWLFDSFEGLPEPGEKDVVTYEVEEPEKGRYAGSEDKAKELLFKLLRLDKSRIHLVKGWFNDTLPRTETGSIALLHLDCDLYESVKSCLEELYDNVVQNGCIVIDDYTHWKGCEEAVTEFIKLRELKVELIKYGGKGREGVYFYKTPAKA
jgi:hypothetical protein